MLGRCLQFGHSHQASRFGQHYSSLSRAQSGRVMMRSLSRYHRQSKTQSTLSSCHTRQGYATSGARSGAYPPTTDKKTNSSHAKPAKSDHVSEAIGTQELQNFSPIHAGAPITGRAQGRSCLLTGATSGIGFAVLTRLLAEGASHIRIVTRDEKRGHQAIDRARKESGRSDGETIVLEQDLGEMEFSAKMLFAVGDDSPAVDTFIHCAGISQSSLAIATPATVRSSILRINAEVYMSLVTDFLKHYHSLASKSKSKSVAPRSSFCAISISSLLAVTGGYGSSTYAASKAAMLAYNRALSLEAGQISRKHEGRAPNFRINTVVPGYIVTPMIQNFTAATKADLENDISLGRFGSPDEVADAVHFLLANEYANNCILNLDGGLSAT